MFRCILRDGISCGQHAVGNRYARQAVSILQEIHGFTVDIFAGNAGQRSDILERYIQGFVIQVQARLALIIHIADIPCAAVVRPALFIAAGRRLDGIVIRQGYQTIGILGISGNADICACGRAGDIQCSTVRQVGIVGFTAFFVTGDLYVTLYGGVCIRADIHAGAVFRRIIARDCNAVRDRQTAVIVGLRVSIYAAAKPRGIVADFSVITDCNSSAVCNEYRAAAGDSFIALKYGARSNIQYTTVIYECACAAHIGQHVVYKALCDRGIGQRHLSAVSNINNAAVICTGRAGQSHIIKGELRAGSYADKAALRADRPVAGKLDRSCAAAGSDTDRHICIIERQLKG